MTQYFWPENFRINDLVIALRKRGHDVTVAAGLPNYPQGKFYPGYGLFSFAHYRENWQGVDVVRFPMLARGRSGGFRLALNYLSFALFCTLLAPFRCRGRFDAIFVYEPSPITVAFPALLLRAIGRGPVFLWVLDLWPESVAAAGGVGAKWVLRAIDRMVRYIYKRCDLVLVQSPGFVKRVVEQEAVESQVRYFPSWADDVFSEPGGQIADPGFVLPQGFRIVFAGNIGAAQDFGHVLAAAQRLANNQNIHWIIVGDGRMADWVRETVVRRNLESTVHLLGSHAVEKMPNLFSNADALLVSLKKDPVFALTIPAKIQSYLAAGRPILAMLDGEGARIVEEAKAGLCCAAEDDAMLARNVLRLAGMSAEEREDLGRAGRRYYLAEFERDMLVTRLEEWIKDLSSTVGSPMQRASDSKMG